MNQINKDLVNGISLEAMGQTGAALEAHAELAGATFAITSRWQGATRHVCRAEPATISGQTVPRGHAIEVDEPVAIFGSNRGMNPQELLLSALATCVGTVYVLAATKRGIQLEDLEVRCETSLDLRGAFGIDPSIMPGSDSISFDVSVRADATDAQLDEMLQEAIALSPNRYQIASPIRIDASVSRL